MDCWERFFCWDGRVRSRVVEGCGSVTTERSQRSAGSSGCGHASATLPVSTTRLRTVLKTPKGTNALRHGEGRRPRICSDSVSLMRFSTRSFRVGSPVIARNPGVSSIASRLHVGTHTRTQKRKNPPIHSIALTGGFPKKCREKTKKNEKKNEEKRTNQSVTPKEQKTSHIFSFFLLA